MSRLSTIELHGLLDLKYRERDGITIELVEGADPAINVTMHEYGDMQIQIAASGSQIFVSTILAPADKVKDRAGLNDACLRLNPINPLSNLGLIQHEGRDTYIVFGELSTASTVDDIDEEIHALAANTIDAAESLKPYFV